MGEEAFSGIHGETSDNTSPCPLDGLTVIDLSTTTPGAQATQYLADGGADVVHIEAPGGTPLRAQPGWPNLARGKHSLVLDVRDESDRQRLFELIGQADVLVTTFRPQALDGLGLDAASLRSLNPRLVSASITGWGPSGPWAHLQGYEGMVMAKLGMFHTKQEITRRPGPAFISVPFATWGAAHSAVQGILAALIERESTGHGQHVEADLVRGATALDTWTWFAELVGLRWPDAFEPVEAFNADGEPQAHLMYPLLIAPTKDGHWLQFAQVQSRLFAAMIEEFGLTHLLSDPKWKGFPMLESQELRTELWETMLNRVSERTLSEWNEVFENNPNISAELFRTGREALDHPQLLHEGRTVTSDDPEFGAVRQPSTLVHVDGKPLMPPRPTPRVGEGGDQFIEQKAATKAAGNTGSAPAGQLPLQGVTVVELGLMFAGPYGATLLTDLGARVIKIEQLEGDSIRNVLAFPEAGGAKVMQGKESIALDLSTDEGRQIVYDIVRQSDIVLQSFRAGVVERIGLDKETLATINPNLVYVNAPGYGNDGPYGGKPAYAPSVGAAGGLALTDAPDAAHKTGSLGEIKKAAVRLNSAGAVPTLQADGATALGVASTMLLGLFARARGQKPGALTTTMLATTTHVLFNHAVDYAGRASAPMVDENAYGYHACYRLYACSQGWVFLAVPEDDEWQRLVSVPDFAALGEDDRFSSAQLRQDNDAKLAGSVARVFANRTAAEWEELLTGADVGCVVAHEGPPERLLQCDEALIAEYTEAAVSPIFEEHRRLAPTVRFSRSATQAKGGCRSGDHTDAILAEIGYRAQDIAKLRESRVVD